jgi:hypothetical protein
MENNMLKNKITLKRVKEIDRFNRNVENTNFFNNLQEIMFQRLNLNYIDKYSDENVETIIKSVSHKLNKKSINTKITNGFLLSCRIEPEIYLVIQETVKKLTGSYMAMDELIYMLLTYFCFVYNDREPKKILPFEHKYKGRSKKKIQKFEEVFGKYYKNIPKNIWK